MTVGPDGNLWFTDSGKIARVTPQGVITEFTVPNPATAIPLPGIARGPDGNLWYIAGTTLGRITPQGRAIGAVAMPPGVWYITGLTTAPDGTLWVGLSTESETDQQTHKIAKVTASGEVTAFALPGPVAPTAAWSQEQTVTSGSLRLTLPSAGSPPAGICSIPCSDQKSATCRAYSGARWHYLVHRFWWRRRQNHLSG